MSKLGFKLATTCIAALLFAFMPDSQVQAKGQGITGTWIVTVTVNTPPGAPPFVFTDLLSFNFGGTLTGASSAFNGHTSENPNLPPPLVVDTSDAYGVWRPVAETDQFAITFKRFLFAGSSTSTALYGSFFPGQYIGENVVQAVGTFRSSKNGDTISGPFTNQFVNLAREVVFAGSGTFSATRVEIQPLTTP